MPTIFDHWGAIWGGKSPDLRSDGPATEISAALWSSGGNSAVSFSDCVPDTHTIALLVRGQHALRSYRGKKLLYSKQRTTGQATISVAGDGGQRKEVASRSDSTMVHIYIPHRYLSEIVACEVRAREGSSVELIDAACANDRHLASVAREVVREMREKQPFHRLRLDALGQDLAIHVLRTYSNLTGSGRMANEYRRGGLNPRQLATARERMLESVRSGGVEPSLKDLASVVGLSVTHFCRAFAQSMGVPPHRWLTERRIERAQILISADPRRDLTDVALDVGFASQTSLGRAFQRVIGITPSSWRNSC